MERIGIRKKEIKKIRKVWYAVCLLFLLCLAAGCAQEGEGSILLPGFPEEGGSPDAESESDSGSGADSGKEPGGSPGSDAGQEAGGSPGSDAGREVGGSPGSDAGREAGGSPGSDAGQEPGSGPDAETLIYVQVSGAVVKPGVYALPAGARIFQAVELAGGLSEEADGSSLNQAGFLEDGQMVYVMDKEEAAAWAKEAGNVPGASGEGAFGAQTGQAPQGQAAEDGRVNLNTATEAELMALPGIGAAKAKSILAWREENGGFSQIEDLMKIQGIKEGVFSKIKDSVKVE